MSERAQGSALPPGWAVEPVRVLGEKSRLGGETFCLGRAPQIRGVRLPMTGEPALLIADEVGDVRVFTGVFSDTMQEKDLLIRGDGGPDDVMKLGTGGAATPDNYRYTAVLPRADRRLWDMLLCARVQKQVQICRKLSADKDLVFDWMRPLAAFQGIPEAVDWRRDGVSDLLMGLDDGRVVRLPNSRGNDIGFSTAAEVVIDETFAADLRGPVFPCVVDLDRGGRSDLLVGTGDGWVFLFRDVGGPGQVAYARGRRLVAGGALVRVQGPACPTVIERRGERRLLVADGLGAVWQWPIMEVNSLFTRDLCTAFGGEAAGLRRGYARGAWWLRPDEPGQRTDSLLCAAPEALPPLTEGREEPLVFDPPAPELRLRLPQAGRCEVHVGLYRPAGAPDDPSLEARLSDEPVAQALTPGEFHAGPRQELYYETADVNGRDLRLKQVVGAHCVEGAFPVYVDYVRVVPLPDAPKAAAAKPAAPAPVVAAIFDSFMWFWRVKTDTPEDMDSVMGKHKLAGFDLMYYKLGGGSWEYPSRVPGAQNVVPDHPSFTEAEKRYSARLAKMLEGVNRVQLAADACRRQGLRLFGWIRLQNHGEHINGRFTVDRFYSERPDLREKDLNGQPVTGKLCLGYPEVRAFHVAIAEEAIDLGADGIMVDTMRHLPKVMWGDPVVEQFRRRHGLDMRRLPPFDPRVVEMQVDVMTGFLREVRDAIRRKRPGAELHMRVCKPYPLMGCDPGRWAREGVVDGVVIEHRSFEPREADLPGLVEALRGTACLPGAAFTRTTWAAEKAPMHPYRIEKQAQKYLAQGARIIGFYETACVIPYPEFCRAVRAIKDPAAMPSRVV